MQRQSAALTELSSLDDQTIEAIDPRVSRKVAGVLAPVFSTWA
jgi:hypothetical protein